MLASGGRGHERDNIWRLFVFSGMICACVCPVSHKQGKQAMGHLVSNVRAIRPPSLGGRACIDAILCLFLVFF